MSSNVISLGTSSLPSMAIAEGAQGSKPFPLRAFVVARPLCQI